MIPTVRLPKPNYYLQYTVRDGTLLCFYIILLQVNLNIYGIRVEFLLDIILNHQDTVND